MDLATENGRLDRAHNIAIVFLKAAEKRTSEQDYIEASYLRQIIRDELGLPKLTGEDHLGDLRAHGDAYGKHCLGLDVLKNRYRKAILLNNNNIQICKDFLAKRGSGFGKLGKSVLFAIPILLVVF